MRHKFDLALTNEVKMQITMQIIIAIIPLIAHKQSVNMHMSVRVCVWLYIFI